MFREIIKRGFSTIAGLSISRIVPTIMAIGSGAFAYSAYSALSSGDISLGAKCGGPAITLGALSYACKIVREDLLYDRRINPDDTFVKDIEKD